MNNGAPLLAVSDLHAHYGKSHILHGVTFNVGSNEVVSLLGRNGSGRSTTMKSIMGLVPPTQGAVHLDGRSLTRARPYEICRAGIAYVPEEREVFANLTVDENFRMGEQPARPGATQWLAQDMYRLLPDPERSSQYQGRQPVRRRTADADDLPLAAGQSAGHSD